MSRVFLTAHWRDLIIASYAVDPEMLMSRLPPGLELDLFEGQAVCSLVGFRFEDTRVMGVQWPGYRNFPEINLRFYVRESEADRRGVVFVRELVKHRFVAGVARVLYNEPYVRARIGDRITDVDGTRKVEYNFSYGGGDGTMRVESDSVPVVHAESSPEHWFKEHQWGYGVTRRGRLLRYEVQHPNWACYPVRSSEIEVDWGRIYGREWDSMSDAKPFSVVLAEGSEIKVFGAQRQ